MKTASMLAHVLWQSGDLSLEYDKFYGNFALSQINSNGEIIEIFSVFKAFCCFQYQHLWSDDDVDYEMIGQILSQI